MGRNKVIGLYAGAALASLGAATDPAHAQPVSVAVAPATLPPVAAIDERYLSYNVEMAEVIGGNFWKPYDAMGGAGSGGAGSSASGGGNLKVGQDPTMYQARPPLDLTDARLRKLAAALGPAYVRVSGSWANQVFFHDSDAPAPASAPAGFQGVLTRPLWRGAVEFTRAVDGRLVTSFAIGTGVRDAAGVWRPDQARKLVAYTGAIGGEIAAAEFFNEPTMAEYGGAPAGYDAAAYARDFAVFRSFAATVPGLRTVDPAAVGEDGLIEGGKLMGGRVLRTRDLLSATPRPVSDVFSYHFYGAVSIRCASMGERTQTTAEAALSEEWLARADRGWAFYGGLRERFEPGKPVWVTEIADAACGGNPWAVTFLDSFRFLDQAARLAKRGVSAIFHNTLAASEYGLLDERGGFAPRPNYWAALLWRRLMGTTVLDAGPSRPGLHLYAHCLRGRPGGVALLAINLSRTEAASVALPAPAERYTLASAGAEVQSARVRLNGDELALGTNDDLPRLAGVRVPPGPVDLAPATITFLAVADAGNGACR